VTSLRKLLLDAAENPFLLEELRSEPDAAIAASGLTDEAVTAIKARDPRAIVNALGVGAPARPWRAQEMALIGIGLFVWPNFLSEQECAAVRHAMDGAPSHVPVVLLGTDLMPEGQLWRATLHEPDDDTRRRLVERLAMMARVIAVHFNVDLVDVESPAFVRYRTGDYFGPHVDNIQHPLQPEPGRRRQVSVTAFLNSPATSTGVDGVKPNSGYTGGQLRLYRSTGIQPLGSSYWDVPATTGALVAYRSVRWSQITTVNSGSCDMISGWLLGQTRPTGPTDVQEDNESAKTAAVTADDPLGDHERPHDRSVDRRRLPDEAA
jgi:predicted 2-oxoglutarate/Fe(II)-dependent dioxygenase YbiX